MLTVLFWHTAASHYSVDTCTARVTVPVAYPRARRNSTGLLSIMANNGIVHPLVNIAIIHEKKINDSDKQTNRIRVRNSHGLIGSVRTCHYQRVIRCVVEKQVMIGVYGSIMPKVGTAGATSVQ